jgi:hypothetical protein
LIRSITASAWTEAHVCCRQRGPRPFDVLVESGRRALRRIIAAVWLLGLDGDTAGFCGRIREHSSAERIDVLADLVLIVYVTF